MAVRAGRPGRAQIEIGLQPVLHPQQHGLAETADHDPDRGQHRDGSGERAHQHRRAAQRSRQAARGQQRLDAEQAAGSRPDQRATIRRPGRESRAPRRRSAGPPRDSRTAACRRPRAAATANQAATARTSAATPDRATGASGRRDRAGRAPSPPPGPLATPPTPARARRPRDTATPIAIPASATVPGQRDRRGRAGDIQRLHRRGHQPHRAHGHQASERHAGNAPGQAQAGGFQQKGRQHATTRRAERAQDSDLLPPPHHRNRNRVVDQKRADHQRDVAQHPQIPSERGEHAAVLVRTGALRRQSHARGQGGAQRSPPTARCARPGGTSIRMRSSASPRRSRRAAGARSITMASPAFSRMPRTRVLRRLVVDDQA